MPFPGQKLPHRTLRGLALEKGTVPAGFEGMATPDGKDQGGPAAIQAGYADNGAPAREGMEAAIGAPIETQPSPFKLGGGT